MHPSFGEMNSAIYGKCCAASVAEKGKEQQQQVESELVFAAAKSSLLEG